MQSVPLRVDVMLLYGGKGPSEMVCPGEFEFQLQELPLHEVFASPELSPEQYASPQCTSTFTCLEPGYFLHCMIDAGRYASRMHTLTSLEWRPLAWVSWGLAIRVDKVDTSIQYSPNSSSTH